MKTLKKIALVMVIAIGSLSMDACKKDCTRANDCINKLKALDRKIRENGLMDKGRVSAEISCEDLLKEVEALYKDCSGTGAVDKVDYDYLKELVDDNCYQPT